jgi:hypothetical protein
MRREHDADDEGHRGDADDAERREWRQRQRTNMPAEWSGPHACQRDEHQGAGRKKEPVAHGPSSGPIWRRRVASARHAHPGDGQRENREPGEERALLVGMRQDPAPQPFPVRHPREADHVGAERPDFGDGTHESVRRMARVISP